MKTCSTKFQFPPVPNLRHSNCRRRANYPLFCAKCRQEILVDVVKMKMVLSDSAESEREEKSSQK